MAVFLVWAMNLYYRPLESKLYDEMTLVRILSRLCVVSIVHEPQYPPPPTPREILIREDWATVYNCIIILPCSGRYMPFDLVIWASTIHTFRSRN